MRHFLNGCLVGLTVLSFALLSVLLTGLCLAQTPKQSVKEELKPSLYRQNKENLWREIRYEDARPDDVILAVGVKGQRLFFLEIWEVGKKGWHKGADGKMTLDVVAGQPFVDESQPGKLQRSSSPKK